MNMHDPADPRTWAIEPPTPAQEKEWSEAILNAMALYEQQKAQAMIQAGVYLQQAANGEVPHDD
jgi:hypothetical protein